MHKLSAGLLFATAIAQISQAGLMGPMAISDLEKSAEVIVVGTAGACVNPAPECMRVQVDRVIKGAPALAGTSLTASWTNQAPAFTGSDGLIPAPDGHGIWFFENSPDGLSLVPVMHGGVPPSMMNYPAPAGPIIGAYAYEPGASVTDKLAFEVGSAIEGLNGEYNLQLYSQLYGLFDELKSPATALLYRRLASSSSYPQRILGLAGSIRSGSVAALTSAAQIDATLADYPVQYGMLLESIGENFRAMDADSVSAAGKAAVDANNPRLDFRQAVAHALAAIHTRDALPYLATLLEDPDATLRAEGIGGMGSFANSQTAGPYKTDETVAHFAMGVQTISSNEEFYLTFWRAWWTQNRAGLGF